MYRHTERKYAMTDEQIIDLYWKRSENAIQETDIKYGCLCYAAAYRILADRLDAEECVNDSYLRLWKAIPPKRPQSLRAFLGKIVRNLALNRYEKHTAAKRGGGEVPLALEELSGCLPGKESTQQYLEEKELRKCISAFLRSIKKTDRMIFLLRYWELQPVAEIAKAIGASESKVKMSLHRSRKGLKVALEKEGIMV